ncbi:unnamed protein product, partial [marine sediment metagenome]
MTNGVGIIVDLFGQLRQVKSASFIHYQLNNCIALIFKFAANRQHSRMLNPGSYDFAFVRQRSQRAFDSGVVTFGAAAGKYNLARLT